jgi:hypothetical protein
MKENNSTNLPQNHADRMLLEKRRKYMRAYYLRKKAGKVNTKKKKEEVKFSIRRGHFLVFFE